MTEAQVQQRRVALGLDGGPIVRYIRWVARTVHSFGMAVLQKNDPEQTRVLEPDWSGYADVNIGADNSIYCLYESGCVNNVMWDVKYIVIEKFNLSWLLEKSPR